jgi:tRNA1Val (adenine37-N6)-methyltransferase
MCPSNTCIPGTEETLDTIFDGRLKIVQPKKGYRFSIDAVLLSGLTRIRARDRIVDLGTGCGIIPLLLAFRRPVAHITGIEIQESLVSLAQRNVAINEFGHLISIVHKDFKTIEKDGVEGSVTLVVSNPPYRELHSGRLNPNREKALARHEVSATLADVVGTAAELLSHKGRLALIYPSRRLPHLLDEVSRGGFAPKRLTLIHTTLSSEAKRVHLECIKGGGEELQVDKPFAIYQKDGSYTPEMAAMYQTTAVVS